MKTISGKVVSSNSISLSKASNIMSGFAAAVDSGASKAVREYLKRTSNAFNSLVQFHKELKTQISHRKGNASQPIVSAVKTETLADTGESPEEKKVQKRKKNHELEASQLVTVKTEEKKDQFGSNNEGAEAIAQGAKGANESSGKKGKKKDKKERKQIEEPLGIVQSSDEHVKVEKIEYEDARKEFDGSGVKRGKKKRKRDEDEVGEKSLEEDAKTENVGEAVDEGKQDGKKKRKKMKTERID